MLAIARWGEDHWLDPFVGLSGLATAAAVLGTSIRNRRALVASLQERAERLELERDRERQLAAAAERARISREMHDIVAHNLAVMVSLADGAANVAPHSPERAQRAMNDVATTGRHALVEMRRLLGVLREDGPQPNTPQPGLEAVGELVDHVRAAGMPVVRSVSEPDFAPSSGLQLAVYRIVQESLTNAFKHGGAGAEAAVQHLLGRAPVTVEVTNTGAANGAHRAGAGLTGMRERAAAFNGSVDARPTGAVAGRCVRCSPMTGPADDADRARRRPGAAARRVEGGAREQDDLEVVGEAADGAEESRWCASCRRTWC